MLIDLISKETQKFALNSSMTPLYNQNTKLTQRQRLIVLPTGILRAISVRQLPVLSMGKLPLAFEINYPCRKQNLITRGYPDLQRFRKIPSGSQRFAMSFEGLQGFPMIFKDLQGFSRINTLQGFSRIRNGFQGFPRINTLQ